MRGARIDTHGEYYTVSGARFSPPALQQPGIPVWVAATLPARAGVRRALRHEGIFPLHLPAAMLRDDGAEVDSQVDWSEWWLTPAALGTLVAEMAAARPLDGFEVIASGRPGTDGALIDAYARAGATWWFDWVAEQPGTFEATRALVARGPVRA